MQTSVPVRKLASGATVGVVSLAVSAVISFAMTPFVLHRLGDRQYGIWSLVATFVGYYGLLDLGLLSAAVRYFSRALGKKDEESANRVLNSALVVYGWIGSAALVIGACVAFIVPRFSGHPEEGAILWKVILIASAATAITLPVRALIGALNASLRLDRTAALEICGAVLRAILMAGVLWAGGGVIALVFVLLAAAIPQALLHLYYARKDIPFIRFGLRYFDKGTARSLLGYSVFTFLAQVADLLRFQTDPLVIAPILGLVAVSHYRIAAVLAAYLTNVIVPIMGVLTPVFSRQEGAQDHHGIHRTFLLGTKVSICVSSFLGFGLIAWGRPFLTRWVGPRYLDALPCLQILAAIYMIALWQGPSGFLLYGISKHRWLSVFNGIEGVLNVVLSVFFARRYGLIGVAYGTFVSMALVRVMVIPVYTCRAARMDWRHYLGTIGRALSGVGLSVLVPSLITAILAGPTYPKLVATGLLSAMTYAAGVWFTVFSHDERGLLSRALRLRSAPEARSTSAS